MFLDSYQRILDSVHLGLDDDDGPDNSRDSAVNFVSASARFTKKPFLKQLELARRMAREKANRALGLTNASAPNISDLSQGQLIWTYKPHKIHFMPKFIYWLNITIIVHFVKFCTMGKCFSSSQLWVVNVQHIDNVWLQFCHALERRVLHVEKVSVNLS